MLINSLHATNFRKYHKLEVDDIPERGVITVAGLNESGKTSIGEAICFVLFGRTFFLDKKNLHKIVCWGCDVAEVTLKFTTGLGEKYVMWRSVDREGDSLLRLQKITAEGEIDETHTTIEAEDSVNEALSKLLGFDYDSFANSFYLAQRELTSPDPQSDTIKQMAGISGYAHIIDDLEVSNQRNEEAINELTPQIESTQTDLNAIKLDETWLPELVDAEQTLGFEQQQREALVADLNENEQLYAGNMGAYRSAKTMRGLFGVLSMVLLPLAMILWLLWIANKFFTSELAEVLGSFLDEGKVSAFSANAEIWLLPVAVVATIVYIVSVWIKKKANHAMKALDEEARGFSRMLFNGHRYVTTLVDTLLPERVVQMMVERTDQQTTLQTLPPREQFNNLVQLIEDTSGYQADSKELTSAVSRLSNALKKQDGEIEDLGNALLDDIDKEKTRSDAAGNLRSSLKGLNKIVNKCKYSIDTQNIAVGLLQRAGRDSITLFNNNIAEISAKTLPSFTEGRYSEIRLAEDFSVQIYSDEKKDYMDFDEISSGTQRQVMLALRMAMSEELAKNSGNDQQFIFLDEPFAFFDQKRTKATLRALPDVSEVISQVWVVAQEFQADVDVDKAIVCPLDGTELLV